MPRKKSKKLPVKILTLDTETYNGLLGSLKKVAVYDGKKIVYGNSFSDIEQELKKWTATHEVHIYIHNTEFDLRKIPELWENIIWEKSMCINRKLAKITCKDWIIHDSLKILPLSLKKLSEGFQVENGKLDLWSECQKRYPNQYENLVDFLDRCPTDDKLFIEYLGYDVISLYEVLYKFMSLIDMNESIFVKMLSTSSISRYLFKNGYKGHKFRSCEEYTDYELLCSYSWQYNLDVEEFLRASYCGGRTEVFKPVLKTKGFHYDVNSLYPSVMIKNEYPIGKPIFHMNGKQAKSIFEMWQKTRKGLGFISAIIEIPKQHIPPLPIKLDKLTFCCGTVQGVWTYEELEYSLKNCGVKIKKYLGVCHFTKTAPIFDDFVSTFSQMKEEGSRTKNEALRTLAKFILNVGYGYTGMRRDDKTQFVSLNDCNEEYALFVDYEKDIAEIKANVKSEYIQVQVASYVTSRARLVLLDALRKTNEKGNVYYCDTDSIVTDVKMPSEMVDKNKIGLWDLESEPDTAIFLKPKVYAEYENRKEVNVKFKGISKDTQSQLTFSYYKLLLHDLIENEKEFRVVEKDKTQLLGIMNMIKNEKDFSHYEIRDKKMNYRLLDKRIMLYSENRTEPIFFPDFDTFKSFSFKEGVYPNDKTTAGNT